MVHNRVILLVFIVLVALQADAQFYNGYSQDFGKNRIQYQDFEWQFYDLKRHSVYFYQGGEANAEYVASLGEEVIAEMEERFDYYLEEKIEFILYNKQSHFRQNNEGVSQKEQNDIGGVMRDRDSKVFVYFNGNHNDLEDQMRAGVANILIHRLVLGKNWREIMKNSTLINIPEWYIDGLVSYMTKPNDRVIESHIADGIITGDFKEFNRLSGEDAGYAGHAIWSYVARTYGEKVIPNILYMSRLSRNVESGFLYVIGLSLKSLNNEMIAYYNEFYRDQERYGDFPKEEIEHKTKKNRTHDQLKINNDGDYISFVENEIGKYRVVIQNISSGKTSKVLSGGKKTGWHPNDEYPILQWHPNGKTLAIIHEKRTELFLTFYTIGEKGQISKPLPKFDQVLSMAYAPDGNTMVLSAVKDGQTDLFEFSVRSSSIKNLTNDIYDDLDPTFISKNKVVFSSNRFDDTLRSTKYTTHVADDLDLFMINLISRNNILKTVTNTPKINEYQPLIKDTANFMFLVDDGKKVSRNVAYFDSVISHIDTAFHYRYVTVTKPMGSYSRNILEQSYSSEAKGVTELFFKDGKYVFAYHSLEGESPLKPSSSKENLDQEPETVTPSKKVKSLEYELYPIIKNADKEIDFNTYTLSSEPDKPKAVIESATEEITVVNEKKDDSPLIVQTSKNVSKPFSVPAVSEYKKNFMVFDINSVMNFNYTTQMYQRYTGDFGYLNPKIALETSVTMADIFTNNEMTAGARFSLDWSIKEYYLQYANRKRRLDKIMAVERQVNEYRLGSYKYKFEYNQARLNLSHPLSERLRVDGTGLVRYDRYFALSTEPSTLKSPILSEGLVGLKANIVYDNTTSLGLNLRKGSRFNLFAETYNGVFTAKLDEGTNTGDSSIVSMTETLKPSTIILGLDYRKYIKVHRNMVWANRLVASTSIGEQKLLYYLGGVDNKVHFTAQPRFDYNLPVVDGSSYRFQTVGTNVRGFLQNTRNGNNMVMVSSELRWPVFSYFAKKPIRSDFVKNFQTVFFTDIGTAWSGRNPYSDDNYFNVTIVGGEEGDAVKVILRNQDEPIIAGYGFGFRSRFLGYFLKLDIAWGVEDGRVRSPRSYLSVGLDF